MTPGRLGKVRAHILDSGNGERMKVGSRVTAVLEKVRAGSIMDIKQFTVLPSHEELGQLIGRGTPRNLRF